MSRASDCDLNWEIARLLGLESWRDDEVVTVDGERFDPVHDNRQCDPLTDRFDIDLSWSEGVWCAQTQTPSGRPVTIDDRLATRAVVRAILAAHGT
ncbi:MAG TPA: hypothetical protein VLA56_03635 [Pseudomonadales bacterium]|nr:hypothetical protein [Pseudomonadales bacterium]